MLACQTALQNILRERHCKFKLFLSGGQCPPIYRFLEFDKMRCVSIKLSHVQWPVTAGHMWGGVTDVWMWHFFRHIIASVTLFPSQLSICDTSLVTCGYLWPIGLSNLRHWQNLEHGNCVTILHYGKFEDFCGYCTYKKFNLQKRCVTS